MKLNLTKIMSFCSETTNMTIYRVIIRADKYPTEYNVEASGWATGVARAIREWKKRFKGSRTDELTIKAVKSSPILRANGEEKDL